MRHSRTTSGFTLLEISIVLLIIGFVVGGLMVGKNMIRASELASISSDIQRYRGAISSFRLKYHFLPGDLPTAYDYWPNSGCSNTPAVGPGHTGCNGNGDGILNVASNPNLAGYYENYRAWQQLALSGIMPGRFTGRPASGPTAPYYAIVNENAPSARIEGVGFVLNSQPISGIASTTYPSPNYIQIAILATMTGFLFADEAQAIDQKLDDGLPTTGTLYGMVANCTRLLGNGLRVYAVANAQQQTMPPCGLYAFIE